MQAAPCELPGWLEQQQEVLEVLHPALESHAGHELWKRDFSGSAGIFSFVLDPDIPVRAFLNGLTIFGLGYSWGGYARPRIAGKSGRPHFDGKELCGPSCAPADRLGGSR
ncbi:PLP-dependent transferase [Rhizobium beringeri]